MSLLANVPHFVVDDGVIVAVGAALAAELVVEHDTVTASLLGPLDAIGMTLDNGTFTELCTGHSSLRVRLRAELMDRPVQLRHLGVQDNRIWIEVRSLAHEFRLESLLRRSGMGHMLISPAIELHWSMSANALSDVFPGDNPLNWVELMDPDDMQTLGKAIFKVGQDPNLTRTVRHRLNADRTYTIIDTIESVMHDPDLRAVLVRSRLEDHTITDPNSTAPFAGITVSDHMPIGVVVASTAGKVLHRNAVAAKFIGAREGHSVLRQDENWTLSNLPVEDVERFEDVFTGASTGKAGHCTISAPDDAGRWLRVSVFPAAASTVVMTIEDMTELITTERALRASNRLLEALDSHSEELVMVFGGNGQASYSSSSVSRFFAGGAPSQFSEFLQRIHVADRLTLADLERQVRTNAQSSAALELRVEVNDPAGRWHHATMTNLLDDGDVGGLVLTLRDVHERHVVEHELRFRATHDALTTLLDRAALRSRLESVLSEAAPLGQRTALVFCDVDNFKAINDRFGHRVGDLVLSEVAARLRSALRQSDFVGRFGGDEFVVVVANVDDEAHALAVARRVFNATVGMATVGADTVDISVSMGVAVTDATCQTVEELTERADVAMYQSKSAGRKRVSLFHVTETSCEPR